MPTDDQVLIQLATRIPKPLHRELKLHCVKTEETVMEFVIRAITEKLQREPAAKAERRRRRA